LSYTVLFENYGKELARRNGALAAAWGPGPGPQAAAGVWNVPPPGQGTLAGYWTLEEAYSLLDSLAATDTLGLVTGVDTIGTSIQGRPILALGIAGPGQPLGTRPEVLFTSLTHAREPGGMQTILYFLCRLLEGYGTDPELTYLVDAREIWFVPVVNPDGYAYNEQTWLDTGSFGLWRKNLRNNDSNPNINSKDGVDLNRNFGFQWGHDDFGSSPDISNPTYRGTGPFSEPETRALRDFVNAHAFRTANNYHTYYELCLYPWGYEDTPTPDSDAFERLGDALTERNHYGYGRSEQVLYRVNGDSNDWMYGDQTSKPKVFAVTHEVGTQNDQFWPSASRILPLAQENLRSNVVLAYAAGTYLTAEELRIESPSGFIEPGEFRPVSVRLAHGGLADPTAGGVTVTASAGGGYAEFTDPVAACPDLGPGDAAWSSPGDSFILHANLSAVPGSRVPVYLQIADGAGYVGRDTLTLRIGAPAVVFADSAGAGLANWTAAGGWGTEIVDGDPAFSDSPGAGYANYADATLTLNPSLDMTGFLVNAALRFRARWDIEVGYDFARLEASIDSGGTWTALPGTGTRPGHGMSIQYGGGVQPDGVPGYDGNQRFWTQEEVDLSQFAGEPDVRVRFRFTSDPGLQHDGWLVDDVRLLAWDLTAPTAAGPVTPPVPALRVAAFPNPVGTRSRIVYSLPQPAPVRVSIFDVTGREVTILAQGREEAGDRDLVWDGRDASGRPVPAGTYFVRVDAAGETASSKLVVLQ
jgi:hypothetical protein